MKLKIENAGVWRLNTIIWHLNAGVQYLNNDPKWDPENYVSQVIITVLAYMQHLNLSYIACNKVNV